MSTTTPDRSRTESLFKKLKRLPKKISAKPDAENVHELRTTIRRVETLLEVTSNGSGRKERKLRKHMDRVRRRAGRVRDIDVQIEALEGLKVDAARDEKLRVIQALRQSRAKREAKLIKVLEEEVDSGMAKHLAKAADRLAEDGHGPRPVISAAKPDPKAVVTHALEAFRDAVERHGTLTEQNLHPFRLACKHVRYIAEMAGEDPEAERIIKQLKKVQDAVGEWHDWVTLSATAVKVLGRDSSPLISAIRTNSRSKFLNAVRIADETKRNLLVPSDTTRKPPRSKPATEGSGVSESAATA